MNCRPEHPPVVVPTGWRKIAPGGFYEDARHTLHVIPHEVCEHLDIDHTQQMEDVIEEELFEFFTMQHGVPVDDGGPLR